MIIEKEYKEKQPESQGKYQWRLLILYSEIVYRAIFLIYENGKKYLTFFYKIMLLIQD
jgi:hypothetical protein